MCNLPQDILQYIDEIAEDECISDIEIKTQVRAFTGDNFLGEIIKVQLIGKCEGKEKRINLVIKKSPESEETRKQMYVSDYYRNEIFTYENILPAFNQLQEKYQIPNKDRFNFVKVYKHSSQDLKELIIMEDLSYDDYTMWERRKPLDNDHMMQVVKELGRLHALSFAMSNENPKMYNYLTGSIPNTENYGEFLSSITESCIELIAPNIENEQLRNKVIGLRGKVKEVFKNCLDSKKTAPYNVICHGDAFRNNFLFKYKNSRVKNMMLIDWQLVRYASPVTDLVYVICLSTDKTTRNNKFSLWINKYYETLSFNLTKMGYDVNECYPKNIFEKHLRELFHFGLVFAFMSISFALKNPGDEDDVDEISEKMKRGDVGIKLTREIVERLEGLLTDCCQLGYI